MPSSRGREQPTGPEHVFCLYSATKAIAATGVWALLEEGKVRLDQRVCEIIPELADLGKDVITLEQVLTFTAGFPLAPMHPRLWEDREARLERMRGWRLNWEPGSRCPVPRDPAHWVLMEVIYRCTGLDFREYLRQRILHPMGVSELFVGLPDEQHHRAADVVYVDPPSNEGTSEANVDTVLHFNLPSQRRAGTPGAGGFSGAGELALFYQRLVSANSGGFTPLRPETVAMAATVHTRPTRSTRAAGSREPRPERRRRRRPPCRARLRRRRIGQGVRARRCGRPTCLGQSERPVHRLRHERLP